MTELNKATFTKADFLTPTQVAQKLNMDKEVVRKAMLDQYRQGTKVLINKMNHTQPMVYNMKTVRSRASKATQSPLRLHPLAMEKFKEILAKGDKK